MDKAFFIILFSKCLPFQYYFSIFLYSKYIIAFIKILELISAFCYLSGNETKFSLDYNKKNFIL